MKNKLVSVALATISLLGIGALITISKAPVLALGSCSSDMEIIFARGSGQSPNGDEANHFFEQLRGRLSSVASLHEYELGITDQYGKKYEAVAIDPITTKLGAWISAGTSYRYRESVRTGEYELAAHLAKTVARCPDVKIVLGGYSQGAHVIGNAIRSMPDHIRDNVFFAALFGDPKLYLPEGEGIFPPACQGKDFSPWRRAVEDCRTDEGSLWARKPYVPQGMENRVGLWCLEDDFICGSSRVPWVSDGHDIYEQAGGPIDQAALEIASMLGRDDRIDIKIVLRLAYQDSAV